MVKEGAINYYSRTAEQFQQNWACDNNLYSLFQLWNADYIIYIKTRKWISAFFLESWDYSLQYVLFSEHRKTFGKNKDKIKKSKP